MTTATSIQKPSILFVDDEINVLSGLRRLLHGYRGAWDMEFASSAQEGLAKLDQRAFDVVVSDMRMPEIDGAQFLAAVHDKHPRTVRFALSGQADEDAILRGVEHIHQYFTKPCEPKDLGRSLESTRVLSLLQGHKHIQAIIGSVTKLPIAPENYIAFAQEITAAVPSLSRLGEIVMRDPGFAAKVLQLVNSSFFTHHRPILNPKEAVTILGIDTLTNLHLTGKVFLPAIDRESPISITSLANDSARAAALEAASSVGDESTEATASRTAQLLSSIGLLMLATEAPDLLRTYLAESPARGEEKRARERLLFGASIKQLGGMLLSIWGLPDDITSVLLQDEHGADSESLLGNVNAIGV